MDFINKPADQGTTLESTLSPDTLADLECPDLTQWASDEPFAPPEQPEFATWESDLPLPEPSEAASFAQVSLPPPEEFAALTEDESVESPSLFPWIGDGWEPEDQTPDRAEDAAEVASSPVEEMDSPAVAPIECPAPAPATCEWDARDRLRRDQMKEYATRLWPGAAQAPDKAPLRDPHLICSLADEDFALPLTGVVEIQRLPAVTPVPHTPEWLIGAVNRRGDILSVVDLAGFLGRETVAASPGRRLIVVKASRDGLTVGLIVDRVRGVRGLASEVMTPSAALPGTARVAHARGTCDDAGRSCTVLDLDGLLLSSRMRRLDLD